MYKLIKIKPYLLFKIKKTINKYRKDTLYNRDLYDGNIFDYLLQKKVYLIKQNKNNIAYVIINSKNKHIYFVNNDIHKKYNFSIINFIYNELELDDYTIALTYKLNYKLSSVKCSNINVINNIKYMHINILKSFEEIIEFIQIKNLEIGRDEEIRVSLQNRIFANGKNTRKQLTLEEIINEQFNPNYIKDLCFILFYYGQPSGYGQIIKINTKYYLVNFGIIPENRCKGLGKIFLSHIINKAYSYGIQDLYLTVDNTNYPAIKLYSSFGFSEVYNILYLYKLC